MQRRVAATLAVAAVAALAGCSSSSGAGQTQKSGLGGSLAEGVGGPWAEEFTSAYRDSSSRFERAILEDGVITPEELESAHDGVRACLADSGYTIAYDDDGGFELGSGGKSVQFERSDSALRACEQQFDDSITYLFGAVRRNPKRLDDASITVDCLQKAKAIDPGYSVIDYNAESEAGEFSFDEMSDAARRCSADPLGLWMD